MRRPRVPAACIGRGDHGDTAPKPRDEPPGRAREETCVREDTKAVEVEQTAGDAPLSLLGLALPPLAAAGGLLGTSFDVSGPESVAQALGLLAFIVAVHEAGHFAAARLQGIHVKRFSVGFGPTLFKYQGQEVRMG